MSDNSQGGIRALKDCTAGSIGGIFQVLAGQPFDTVKVRLQTQPTLSKGEVPQFTGALDCAVQTFKKEGFAGFYKGTATPLAGIGLCVSIQFFALENFKRSFAAQNKAQGNLNPNFLSNSQLFIAGSGAGLANAFVSGPVEHIRTRLQVQSGTNPEFKGPIDCLKKIYSANGLKGLYQGQVPTLAREFIGFGAYFTAYEYLVQQEMISSGFRRDELSTFKVCFFGAMAGYSMWISAFPIDVIKSKMQTDGITASTRKYPTAMSCIKDTYKSNGVKGFFRGFLPCILRAAPANAATFLGFETAMRFLN